MFSAGIVLADEPTPPGSDAPGGKDDVEFPVHDAVTIPTARAAYSRDFFILTPIDEQQGPSGEAATPRIPPAEGHNEPSLDRNIPE